jgi:hypothetical protein
VSERTLGRIPCPSCDVVIDVPGRRDRLDAFKDEIDAHRASHGLEPLFEETRRLRKEKEKQ